MLLSKQLLQRKALRTGVARLPLPHSRSNFPLSSRRAVLTRAGDDQALRDFATLTGKKLDDAARRYATGVAEEIDEDELVAWELGASSPKSLTQLQQRYFDKVKNKLRRRSEELQQKEVQTKLEQSLALELGKEAYATGEYGASVTLFETATAELETSAALQGEAQIWLALAYQACGREQDCVELYKFMENNHPLPKFKKQAANLRYIIEAPKLERSPEEFLKVPLIQSDSWTPKKRKSKVPQKMPSEEELKEREKQRKKRAYWDRDWQLPELPIPDKWYVRVAWGATFIVFTVYANSKLML